MLSTLNSERIINEIINHSDKHIEVLDMPLPYNKSCSFKVNDSYYIILDMDNISSYELRTLLWHELSHCATDTFYLPTDSPADRKQKERQAIAWAVIHCIPFADYLDALKSGVRDVYQLSEYFGITIESALKVIEYYKSKLIEYISIAEGVAV